MKDDTGSSKLILILLFEIILVFRLPRKLAMAVGVEDYNWGIFRYAQDDKSVGLWVKVLLEKKWA